MRLFLIHEKNPGASKTSLGRLPNYYSEIIFAASHKSGLLNTKGFFISPRCPRHDLSSGAHLLEESGGWRVGGRMEIIGTR